MYAHHHGVLQSAITTKIYKHYLRAPQGRILDFEMHWFLCVWPQPLSGPPCPAYNSSKRKRSFRIFPFTPFMFRTLEMNKTNPVYLYITVPPQRWKNKKEAYSLSRNYMRAGGWEPPSGRIRCSSKNVIGQVSGAWGGLQCHCPSQETPVISPSANCMKPWGSNNSLNKREQLWTLTFLIVYESK